MFSADDELLLQLGLKMRRLLLLFLEDLANFMTRRYWAGTFNSCELYESEDMSRSEPGTSQ